MDWIAKMICSSDGTISAYYFMLFYQESRATLRTSTYNFVECIARSPSACRAALNTSPKEVYSMSMKMDCDEVALHRLPLCETTPCLQSAQSKKKKKSEQEGSGFVAANHNSAKGGCVGGLLPCVE